MILLFFSPRIHQTSITLKSYTYHLSATSIDFEREYDLFICDSMGILCREQIYVGSSSYDATLQLG